MTEKEEQALKLATDGIFIDGGHHKQWYLDQIVRVLTGDDYLKYVASEESGEDGPETYLWEEGIAP